ncbi:MAG: GNAT family N-acetyltransferase [Sandaracinaceae bacterium]|nr:GNAT family N-acetyltransferase [Sandaracinaceae bacterium]
MLEPTAVPFAPWALANAEEARIADVVTALGDEHAVIAGVTCAFGGLGSWINQALSAPRERAYTLDDVEAIAAFFTARGAEPKVVVHPYVDPSLYAALAAAGFRLAQTEIVLAIDLARERVLEGPPVAGLRIDPVDPTSARDVDAYVTTASRIFFGDAVSSVLVESIRRSVFHPRATTLLARIDGELAGVAGLERWRFGEHEHAALFGAAVLPTFRRRGVQRALFTHRLALARASGARFVTVASLPNIGTERNALRAGMRLAYVRHELVRPAPGLVPSP